MRTYTVAAVAILLAVAPAWAQRTVDESRPLDSDGTVSISNLAGSVKVIGWSSAEVQIAGTLGKNVEDLAVEGDSTGLSIEVDVPRHADDLESDLIVKVPATADIEIETVSATVEVEGVTGSVDLETVSGWVKTTGRMRELSIETVSGDITVAEASPRTELSSVSGTIALQLATGRLDAETVSGSIRVDNGSLQSGSFETVSGSISYAGDIVGTGEFDFETMSGTISLELPVKRVGRLRRHDLQRLHRQRHRPAAQAHQPVHAGAGAQLQRRVRWQRGLDLVVLGLGQDQDSVSVRRLIGASRGRGLSAPPLFQRPRGVRAPARLNC